MVAALTLGSISGPNTLKFEEFENGIPGVGGDARVMLGVTEGLWRPTEGFSGLSPPPIVVGCCWKLDAISSIISQKNLKNA